MKTESTHRAVNDSRNIHAPTRLSRIQSAAPAKHPASPVASYTMAMYVRCHILWTVSVFDSTARNRVGVAPRSRQRNRWSQRHYDRTPAAIACGATSWCQSVISDPVRRNRVANLAAPGVLEQGPGARRLGRVLPQPVGANQQLPQGTGAQCPWANAGGAGARGRGLNGPRNQIFG